VIPFIVIYCIISVFIGKFVLQDKIRQTNVDVETLARFNETNLRSYIGNVRLVIQIAAAQLGTVNPHIRDARESAEDILLACFENRQIHNTWFVFEPDAFDGRDAEYTDDYPGAPSGRFIRSFVRDENRGFLPVSNIDEAVVDDPEKFYWYTIPKESGRQYTDINVANDFLYRYCAEETAAVSIVCPVFRDGTVIGCVGGDFLLDDVILGPELIPGARSVLFMNNGTVTYANSNVFMGKSIEELDFPNPDRIRKTFIQQESLFLYDEYSGVMDDKAYSYFMPVHLTEFDEIVYIYAAVPESLIMETVYSVFRPVAAALAAALIIFMFLLFYLAKSISEPIRKLTAASEAIARGDFNGEFEVDHARGEIGAMTRSLHHMVEQFQMYITLQERSKELLDIYTRLYETLYQRDNIEDVFDSAIHIIADCFKIKTASLIVLKNEIAYYTARYTAENGLWKMSDKNGDANDAVVFEYHNQAAALLEGRKYIVLNAAGISEQGIAFTAEDCTSLCILPVKTGEILQGYFLMEGNETTGPFVHHDDALIFIADTISYILTRKENSAARFDGPLAGAIPVRPEPHGDYPPAPDKSVPADPVPELPVIRAARSVEGLDVDRGLSLIGGIKDQYGELLRISAKVFSEGIQKMRDQYTSDLPGFAIGIHGMKGALYNIGANELGDAAQKLEFAAKGGDTAFCREAYPVFEIRLAALVRNLTEVTRTEAGTGGAGNIPELAAALEKVLEACRNFDAIRAGKIIAPFTGFSWEPEDIGTDVTAVAEALENIDYDEAEALINSLIKKVRELENGSHNSGGGE
jgi:HAMP domain-containing protein/HPt (histidine-containing phosphotransfer) domain-containing protein